MNESASISLDAAFDRIVCMSLPMSLITAPAWLPIAVPLALAVLSTIAAWTLQLYISDVGFLYAWITTFALWSAVATLIQIVRSISLRQDLNRMKLVYRSDGSPEGNELLAIVEAIELTGYWRPWTIRGATKTDANAALTYLNSKGIVPPITVASIELADALSSIERPDYLVEPERVESSTYVPRGLVIALVCLYVLLAVLFAFDGMWGMVLLMLLYTAAFLAWNPRIRRRLRPVRPQSRLPLVAPGVVVDRRDRRWTVNDSIMLVRSKKAGRQIIVDMLGQAARLRMAFAGPDEPDFIDLWQRWNHPNPRPELLQ